MGTRKEVFYKNVIIDEADKARAELFLASKGVEKHIILKEKLFNWIEGDQIEYSMIASTYRYDKRLRIILFKYISYLEEFYRAIILDEYVQDSPKIKPIRDIKQRMQEFQGNMNETLENIDFSTLLIQVKYLPKAIRERHNVPSGKHLKDNMTALKELRNAVMHNKFLLLYRGFETCYIDGDDNGKTSLKANILNMINFLPEDVAINCRSEINDAKNEKDNQSGTKWNLPSFVIIQV